MIFIFWVDEIERVDVHFKPKNPISISERAWFELQNLSLIPQNIDRDHKNMHSVISFLN